ncbi:LuxR C-terminal-related transcriptional regulator [Belliella sp. DSM 107340]|uniref:LuxR C-terminal-related transcriptional regulator n=1 Tax=Belliella calami TaxID=2923436 RepID=A0ABS9UP28_9BACT|nr:LuxR C-terminal-related transcriptional regulator [Belliella calami]MCH7398376.1 LuxR C-terminal-related transcriptional regulator [Belliella calami]
MNRFNTTILLIGLGENQSKVLGGFLESKGFLVYSASNERNAELIINQEIVHLVVCNQVLESENSISFFLKIKPLLKLKNIPFFFLVNEFNKDDILVSLELGVSNFIFAPFSYESILSKIQNEFDKKASANFSLNPDFDSYFNENTIPLIFIHKEKVKLLNPVFFNVLGEVSEQFYDQKLKDVFDINGTENNSFRFKRFESSLTKYCKLKHVKVLKGKELYFDLFLLKDDNKDIIVQATISTNTCKVVHINSRIDGAPVNLDKLANAKLTKREKQIFNLSASGLPIKIIAQELKLSARTIEKHRSNIMEKVGAKNMIEAIRNL